jgi:hypothetical protein
MKGSWYDSVVEHRQRVYKSLRDTPSLKSYLETAIQSAYPDARKVAIKEGKLATGVLTKRFFTLYMVFIEEIQALQIVYFLK